MKNFLFLITLLPACVAPAAAQASIPSMPTPQAARPPGLYVQVLDGLIHVTNPAGTQNFSAGQFGFTPSFTQPPVLVPTNPGLQFTPPPIFKSASAAPGSSGAPKTTTVDCEVR